MAIIGEMFVGSESGIGRRLYDANLLLRIPEMYAIIILSGFIGYLLNQLFVIIEHKVFFWGGK
jgi:NitT/TauT family transport system permease protein